MLYKSSRFENPTSLQLKIPWDSNTARGFILSLTLYFIFFLFAPYIEIGTPKVPEISYNTVPLELLNFGNGDGTGISKGNLSEEGKSHEGKTPSSDLEDARIKAETKPTKSKPTDDISESSNIKPVKQISSNDIDKNKMPDGSDRNNIGSPSGTKDGTGLGSNGTGKGKGLGFGDIEWGGGGNRTVLYKKLPDYPQGVNKSAQIKIKFSVLSDGTVGTMVPIQKGEPMLERAAMNALRQWRFNPLKEKKEMLGIITFTFRLS